VDESAAARLRRFVFAYDRLLPLDVRSASERVDGGVCGVELSLLSVHGQRVPAVVTRPAGSGRRPALLLQHGGGRSKDERLIVRTMDRWARAGFVCLAIDAPDHGARAGDAPIPAAEARRSLPYRQRDNRVQNVVDLRRAIDFLETLDCVDRSRLGFWGISMGVSVGVPFVAVDERVKAACFALGGSRSRRRLEGVPDADLDLMAAVVDALPCASAIAPRPVLMLNGRDDATVPTGAAEELFAALGAPKELRWFATGHRVTAAMLSASLRFFIETLGPVVGAP